MNLEDTRLYNAFRSSVAHKRIVVSSVREEMWSLYEAGPRDIKYPIVFLPPCSGTADIFFKQILHLSNAGYRVISVNYPIVWSCEDWCDSFVRLLDKLNLFQVHLFGASLGGFLAQKFVEYSDRRASRVLSIILCNSFSDTSIFNLNLRSKLFWILPRYVLSSSLISGLSVSSSDHTLIQIKKFIENRMKTLGRLELASRLTLNCTMNYVDPNNLFEFPITIIDVYDRNALTSGVGLNLLKCYPNAKRAHMKSGGNFPYLSRSSDVNIFIQVHMNQFLDSPFAGREVDEAQYVGVNHSNEYRDDRVISDFNPHCAEELA